MSLASYKSPFYHPASRAQMASIFFDSAAAYHRFPLMEGATDREEKSTDIVKNS